MAYVNDDNIHSHLDRLDYNEDRERQGYVGQYWIPALFGGIGFSGLMAYNVANLKPAHTGIWRAAVIVPVLAAAGLMLRDNNREKNRLKWAKIRHYIELHPSDFPPYPRRLKVGETLAPWIPRRSGW